MEDFKMWNDLLAVSLGAYIYAETRYRIAHKIDDVLYLLNPSSIRGGDNEANNLVKRKHVDLQCWLIKVVCVHHICLHVVIKIFKHCCP